jgi:hypothetical protein
MSGMRSCRHVTSPNVRFWDRPLSIGATESGRILPFAILRRMAWSGGFLPDRSWMTMVKTRHSPRGGSGRSGMAALETEIVECGRSLSPSSRIGVFSVSRPLPINGLVGKVCTTRGVWEPCGR